MIVLPSSVVFGSPGKEDGGLPEDLGERSKGNMGGAEANAITKKLALPSRWCWQGKERDGAKCFILWPFKE